MNAGELCCCEVITATRDMPIREAAQLMRDRHVGSLVVVEGSDDRQELVGILALDDILELLSEELSLLTR
ncbi:MAG: CBS domain-containing protein, partial [Thiohalobacterales bacterium]